jgi:hypothetical protein
VTRLISIPVLSLQSETPHVVSYDFGPGSATVPVAVFGVAPKTRQPTNLSNDVSGATLGTARETRALPQQIF